MCLKNFGDVTSEKSATGVRIKFFNARVESKPKYRIFRRIRRGAKFE